MFNGPMFSLNSVIASWSPEFLASFKSSINFLRVSISLDTKPASLKSAEANKVCKLSALRAKNSFFAKILSMTCVLNSGSLSLELDTKFPLSSNSGSYINNLSMSKSDPDLVTIEGGTTITGPPTLDKNLRTLKCSIEFNP